MNKAIKFTKNWNGKLNNNFYTTIRGYHHPIGTKLDVMLKEEKHHEATVIEVITTQISEIPEWLYRTDCGYPKIEGEAMICQLTKRRPEDTVSIMVLAKTAEYRDTSL